MIQELAKIATVKAVAEKDLKVLVDGLEVGVHPVDCQVRLVGGITKGKPYKQRVAAAADPWKLLALALSKLNNSSVEALVAEAADLEQVGEDEIKERAKRAIETIVAGTEREISGRVTAAIQWSLLA